MQRRPVFDLVVIGGSAGSLRSLLATLTPLPPEFPVPIVVVQHRPSELPDQLPALLGYRSALRARLAAHGERPAPGIAVVPGRVRAGFDGSGRFTIAPSERNSVDELLLAAAERYDDRLIAVILSGRGQDGAIGVRAVKRSGGRVLAEDPATARAPAMPTASLATGCADFALPAHRLASALTALVMAPGAAELLRVPPPPWALVAS
jgi:two-component system chemotaxis response regulator CheB